MSNVNVALVYIFSSPLLSVLLVNISLAVKAPDVLYTRIVPVRFPFESVDQLAANSGSLELR